MSTAKVITRNFTALMLGNIVTRVLSVIYIAVLARYIGAEGIGQLGAATAIVSLLILVVNFGFDTLITREVAADETTAPAYITNLVFLRLVLTLIFSAVLIAIALWSPYSPMMRQIIIVYAFVYVFDNFSGLARAIFQAYQRMEYEVVIELIRATANIIISLVGIHGGWSLVAIVGASAFASLLKLILSYILIRWRFVRSSAPLDRAFCRRVLLTSIPFFLLMAANVAQGQVNVLALSLMDTERAVGLFSAGAYPITMLFIIPTLFMDSIYPAFSHDFRHSPARLAETYQRAHKFMTLVGFPLGVGIMVVSRPIIDLLYGPGFEGAALALAVLAVQLVTAVGYVNGALLNAVGRQSLFMKLRLATLCFNILLCILLVPRLSYLGSALACIIPTLIDYVFYTVLCHRLIGAAPDWSGAQAKIALATAGMAAACLMALSTGMNLVLVVLLPGAALYIGLLLILNVLDEDEWTFIRELTPIGRLLGRSFDRVAVRK